MRAIACTPRRSRTQRGEKAITTAIPRELPDSAPIVPVANSAQTRNPNTAAIATPVASQPRLRLNCNAIGALPSARPLRGYRSSASLPPEEKTGQTGRNAECGREGQK